MSDATELREYLFRTFGTDWDVPDEHLEAYADRAHDYAKRAGSWWPWERIAAYLAREAVEGPPIS